MSRLKLLVFEPNPALKEKFTEALMHADCSCDIIEHSARESLISALLTSAPDLIVLGESLEEKSAVVLVREILADERLNQLAIVLSVPRDDGRNLLPLVEAGTHGVLFTPFLAESVEETLRHAVLRRRQRAQASAAGESVQNLAGIIEDFAERLETLSEEIKKREKEQGTTVPTSTKKIQEALLSAVALTNPNDTEAVRKLVENLLRDD